MKIFLWTLLGLFSISAVTKLMWFVNGFPARQPFSEAVDLVLIVALIAWTCVLLFS